MAAQKKNAREISVTNWSFWSDEAGLFADGRISAGAAVHAAQQLERIGDTLDAILSQIRSLGSDGIHTAIRGAAAKVRRAEKRERARRKAAREAKKAAP
jgi:hypothetical protein